MFLRPFCVLTQDIRQAYMGGERLGEFPRSNSKAQAWARPVPGPQLWAFRGAHVPSPHQARAQGAAQGQLLQLPPQAVGRGPAAHTGRC